LTERQLDDLARRNKLQHLRAQEDQNDEKKRLTSPFEPISNLSFQTQSSVQYNRTANERVDSEELLMAGSDGLNDHCDDGQCHGSNQVCFFDICLVYPIMFQLTSGQHF
jgi:hypothetical protein